MLASGAGGAGSLVEEVAGKRFSTFGLACRSDSSSSAAELVLALAR